MTAPQLMQDRNYAVKNLGKVCILGLGKTGNALAKYLCENLGKRVETLHVYAGEKKEFAMKSADKLLGMGATVSFDDKEINEKYDLCIASPGIPFTSDLIKSAKKCCGELISEVEFAWREAKSSAKWVAVTGTNGKTTTTSMLEHVLLKGGKHALAVGNIGNVAIEAVAADEWKSRYEQTDIYVLEMSSYQLAGCEKFSADIAVLLNITPDHLDWHGDFENYKQAKLNVFNKTDVAVLNMDDKVVKESFDEIVKKELGLIIKNYHADDNIIVEYKGQAHNIMPISELKLIGEHNCVNARAVASVCLALGLNDAQIAEGIRTFGSLEHRLESCGIVAGVRLYNDSKATNVDSVLVAIDAFPKKKAIFMLGGKDKNTDIDQLVAKSIDNLKGVVVYGEAKDRFMNTFQKAIKNKESKDFILEQATNMGGAFKIAMEKAFPGDYVVLSPACSSFDEFDNFEQRGEIFKALVDKCK